MTPDEHPSKSYLGPVGTGFAILGVSIVVGFAMLVLLTVGIAPPPDF